MLAAQSSPVSTTAFAVVVLVTSMAIGAYFCDRFIIPH
jgi:hypothetical protein